MKTLIVDDEADARERLARLVKPYADVIVIGEARDGIEALEKIEQQRPDLVFLDIEMPGLSGFEMLRALGASVPLPLVIFVTAYDQHALAAFAANALAYLLKPVEQERLALAIERARKLNAVSDEKERESHRILQVARKSPKMLRQVVCRKRDTLVLLRPDQVYWFGVEDGLVRARTATDSFWVNYQLIELEGLLPPEMFFRVRREMLVNMTKVKEIRPHFKNGFLLVMSDSAFTEIIVSERQVPSLRERLPGL